MLSAASLFFLVYMMMQSLIRLCLQLTFLTLIPLTPYQMTCAIRTALAAEFVYVWLNYIVWRLHRIPFEDVLWSNAVLFVCRLLRLPLSPRDSLYHRLRASPRAFGRLSRRRTGTGDADMTISLAVVCLFEHRFPNVYFRRMSPDTGCGDGRAADLVEDWQMAFAVDLQQHHDATHNNNADAADQHVVAEQLFAWVH